MRRILLEQGSEEWLEWRRGGLGSSDVAAIIGKSPFSNALKVYNEKSGFTTATKANIFMARGSLYEAEARKAFVKKKQKPFEPICCSHDEIDYFIASLDGYNPEENTIVEIKIPSRKTLELVVAGEIPEHYQIQMQWQMGVTGATAVYFVCYIPESREMEMVKIERDTSFINDLQHRAQLFWANFKRGLLLGKGK